MDRTCSGRPGARWCDFQRGPVARGLASSERNSHRAEGSLYAPGRAWPGVRAGFSRTVRRMAGGRYDLRSRCPATRPPRGGQRLRAASCAAGRGVASGVCCRARRKRCRAGPVALRMVRREAACHGCYRTAGAHRSQVVGRDRWLGRIACCRRCDGPAGSHGRPGASTPCHRRTGPAGRARPPPRSVPRAVAGRSPAGGWTRNGYLGAWRDRRAGEDPGGRAYGRRRHADRKAWRGASAARARAHRRDGTCAGCSRPSFDGQLRDHRCAGGASDVACGDTPWFHRAHLGHSFGGRGAT